MPGLGTALSARQDAGRTPQPGHDIRVLEQIRDAFPEYDVGRVSGVFYARLLSGGPLLTAATLGGIASLLLGQLTAAGTR